jgi:hypothetical protein
LTSDVNIDVGHACFFVVEKTDCRCVLDFFTTQTRTSALIKTEKMNNHECDTNSNEISDVNE